MVYKIFDVSKVLTGLFLHKDSIHDHLKTVALKSVLMFYFYGKPLIRLDRGPASGTVESTV